MLPRRHRRRKELTNKIGIRKVLEVVGDHADPEQGEVWYYLRLIRRSSACSEAQFGVLGIVELNNCLTSESIIAGYTICECPWHIGAVRKKDNPRSNRACQFPESSYLLSIVESTS